MVRTARSTLRLLALVPLLALATTDCARNPATGEREISLIGEGQEVQMGREADQQVVASLGVYPNEQLQRYVSEVGMGLAAVAERPDLPWTFRVLDDPTVNAFALPGGFVYITRGIMSHLNSEAELAGILGHEIGHITARHTVNRISRAQLTQLGVGLGMIFVPELQQFAGLADVGLQLLFLQYGRDDEREADDLGVRYMVREGYDPRRLANVMQMLTASSQLEEGSGRVPEWLSTHPDPANRVEAILERVDELAIDPSGMRVQRDGYLRTIDGIVFGDDPREGFFERDVFYHPEMRFRISFPQGWRHVNMKQAVQSISGQEDAVMVLTLAEGAPQQALQSFGAQRGVQVASASSRSVNGLPAATARFAAQTEQGTLSGRVLFVEHGGTTFRILGYGPQQRWGAYDGVVQQSLASFAPESRAEVLNVEPQRLDVVRLDQPLSFRNFIQRYPSVVAPERVALINQVDVDGQLAGGSLAKRVLGGN